MKHLFFHIISIIIFSSSLFAQPDQTTIRLFMACQSGNKAEVLKSLQEGAEADAIDQNGLSPLFYAVSQNNIEIVDLLLGYKADINKQVGFEYEGSIGNLKRPVLMWAMESNSKEMVEHLLSRGADINVTDSRWVSFVCLVVESGNLELLKRLVDDKGVDIHKRYFIEEKSTGTLLHVAVKGEHINIAKYLLDNGADIEARTHDGKSALVVAAGTGNLEMVKLLVEHDAYIYARSARQKPLLEEEAGTYSSKIINYLRQIEEDRYLLSTEEPSWIKLFDIYTFKAKDVEKYYQDGGVLTGCDRYGNTVLHYFADKNLRGNTLFSVLAEEIETDVNAANIYGLTALHCALRKDMVDQVRTLVEHGADVNARDREGNTPLIIIANSRFSGNNSEERKTLILKMLLEKGADVNAQNFSGHTPLMELADARMDYYIELAMQLIEHGADVNSFGYDYQTPLHIAASTGSVAMMKLLIDNGANMDAVDIYGRTILDVAKDYSKDKVDLLFKYRTDVNLIEAAYYSQDEIFEKLIREGADINMTAECCYDSGTSLIIAARHNDIKIIRKSLEFNANINAQDKTGNTALHYAALNGYDDVVWLLLEAGADIKIRNTDQYTAFDLAVINNKMRSVQIIKDLFPDMELTKVSEISSEGSQVVSNDLEEIENEIELSKEEMKAMAIKEIAGQTESAFHKSVIQGDIEAVRSMLGKGEVGVDDIDNLFSTALMYAAYLGHADIVKLLLDSGADVNLKNQQGITSLYLAVLSENKDIAKMLLEAGANPSIKVMDEMNVLQLAIMGQQEEIVKMIQEKYPELEADVEKFKAEFAQFEDESFDPNEFEAELAEEEREWQAEMYAESSESAFHIAVIKGEMEKVRAFLEQGNIDVNGTDEAGMLAITYAAIMGDKDMVKLLIEHGANINQMDKNLGFWDTVGVWGWGHTIGKEVGWGTLHYLAALGDMKMLELFIEQGADVNLQDKEYKRSPTFMALQCENSEALKFLVKVGARLDMLDSYGESILHVYTELGHIDKVKLLLELGADIEVTDKNGETPLMSSTASGKDDALIFLLKQGANINAVDNKGDNALHRAVPSKHTSETIRILVEHGIDINHKNNKGLLPQFCMSGYGYDAKDLVENLQILLDAGADIHAVDENGDTMLHYAFGRWGSIELVKLLINNGLNTEADITALDKDGNSMLHLSVGSSCSVELAKLAIEKGLDVNFINKNGLTPLQKLLDPYYRVCNSKELVKVLVGNGASLDVVNQTGQTLMHNAVDLGWPDIVSYFIEKGAEVNVHSGEEYGLKTPLHLAAEKDSVEIVSILINNRAEIDVQDKYKNTPLHYAAKKGNYEIAKLLAGAGARYDIVNNKDQTAIDVAKEYNKNDIVALFQ